MTQSVFLLLRFGLYLDLSLLFGLPCFVGLLLPAEGYTVLMLRIRRLVPWLALAGIMLSGFLLVVMAAQMAGMSPLTVDRQTLATVVSQTATGSAWLVRTFCLVALLLAALLTGQPRWAASAPIVLLAAGADATLAWNGHGAMDEGVGGWLHLAADIVHVLAAGLWLGAILGFLMLLSAARNSLSATVHALQRFGRTGTGIVLTLIGTGLVNGCFLLGAASLGQIVASTYGRLLALKLLAFAAMLVAAAANRWRLTPRLRLPAQNGDIVRTLRLSLAIETSGWLLILAIVAGLGAIAPPAG